MISPRSASPTKEVSQSQVFPYSWMDISAKGAHMFVEMLQGSKSIVGPSMDVLIQERRVDGAKLYRPRQAIQCGKKGSIVKGFSNMPSGRSISRWQTRRGSPSKVGGKGGEVGKT